MNELVFEPIGNELVTFTGNGSSVQMDIQDGDKGTENEIVEPSDELVVGHSHRTPEPMDDDDFITDVVSNVTDTISKITPPIHLCSGP